MEKMAISWHSPQIYWLGLKFIYLKFLFRCVVPTLCQNCTEFNQIVIMSGLCFYYKLFIMLQWSFSFSFKLRLAPIVFWEVFFYCKDFHSLFWKNYEKNSSWLSFLENKSFFNSSDRLIFRYQFHKLPCSLHSCWFSYKTAVQLHNWYSKIQGIKPTKSRTCWYS